MPSILIHFDSDSNETTDAMLAQVKHYFNGIDVVPGVAGSCQLYSRNAESGQPYEGRVRVYRDQGSAEEIARAPLGAAIALRDLMNEVERVALPAFLKRNVVGEVRAILRKAFPDLYTEAYR